MKKTLTSIILFLLLFGTFGFSYAQDLNADLSDNLIRLHIIANSDSDKDQKTKLCVKNYINSYISSITKEANSKREAETIIKRSLPTITQKVNVYLKEQNILYTATAAYGRYEFPTKSYRNITLPSGRYDGLQIRLGAAEGHNWWCVMYPPLCFTNEVTAYMPNESNEFLKQQLSAEDYAIISSENGEPIPVVYKFKVVEFFQNMRQSVSGNVYSH